MGDLWQDLRYGVRMLLRRPGLTAIAVLTLALGIGANTSIFSLVNSVLLRPLPFKEPERLIVVNERNQASEQGNISGHELVAWRAANRTLEGIAMYGYNSFNLTGRGDPEALEAMVVSGDFFAVLGTVPLAGRAIAQSDDETGAPRVAVLSSGLWQRRFGGDRAVIGRAITLDNLPYTVIGVMPPKGSFDPDLWVPMDLPSEAQKVGKHSNFVIARLKPGVDLPAAQRDLAAISARLEQELPGFNTGHGVSTKPLHEHVVGQVRRPLIVFTGAVAFILLIACANVAHLLLTRAAARQKELAVRTALGAGRGRLIRQLLTESVLLGVAGGGAGILLAWWVVDLLPRVATADMPRMDELTIDGRVLAITVALSLLTGLISGIVPAIQSSRLRFKLRDWMSQGTRATMGPGRRMAGVLVVSEIAVALVLLVGAGLTLKSFTRLVGVDPGFNSENVLTATVSLPGERYAAPARAVAAYEELSARFNALPGVQFVGATSQLPVGPCCDGIVITIEHRPKPPEGQEPGALMAVVSHDYFRAMQMPLRSGRYFNNADARLALPLVRYWEQQPFPAHYDESQAPPVVIINEAMARKYWPGEDAVGKRFRILYSPYVTVVGVVGNVRQRGLSVSPEPEMYLPQSQEPRGALTVVLRTTGDPGNYIDAVRQQIRAFDRDLPAGQILPMTSLVRESVRGPRFNALLLGASGALALALALIGIYGVISYSVASRTQEIGIRTALGADARDVLKLVLGQAMTLAGIGIGIGLAGALALARVLRRMLFEVEPTDPLTFAAIATLLAIVSMLASYLPTRRATRVDPLVALRSE
ncbi:MAG: ABC transporter permease [Gemmatimonadota bacterium]